MISVNDFLDIVSTTKNILSKIFTDNSYVELIYEEIIDDVIEDIKTSADEIFNDSDVSLAVQRSMLRKMGISV